MALPIIRALPIADLEAEAFPIRNGLKWVNIFTHPVNGNTYFVCTFGASSLSLTKPVWVWRYDSAGLFDGAWSRPDFGNAPTCAGRVVGQYDGQPSSIQAVMRTDSNVIVIAYSKFDGADATSLAFVEYDMDTDTYGAEVDSGPTVLGTDAADMPVFLSYVAFRPSDGSYVFTYQARTFALGPPQSYNAKYTDCVIYNGGWGVPFQVAGVDGEQNYLPRGIILDPASNRLHLFFANMAYIPSVATLYHRVLKPDNTLTALQVAATGLGGYTNVPCTGLPILTPGGKLAIPFHKDHPVPPEADEPWPVSMALADEAEVPVWATYPMSGVLDDQLTTGPLSYGGWQIATHGNNIRGFWSNPYSPNGFLMQTAVFDVGTLAWSAVDVAIALNDNNSMDYLTAAELQTGVWQVIATDRDQTNNNFKLVGWTFGEAAPPVPPPPVPDQPGWGVYPPYVPVPNFYDRCLCRFKNILDKKGIRAGRLCWEFHEHPGEYRIPKGAVEFYEKGQLDFAAPDANDNLVLEFKVPTGYDGQLYGLTLGIICTGFEDGSGDVAWRVRVGNAWGRNLGNVFYQIGQVQQCLQLSDHIQVLSDQTIQILAAVPNTGGGIDFLDPVRVICIAQGWYYPNR